MCIKNEDLLDLCDLFPQTKENITRIALERRVKFMNFRKLNSKKYWDKRGLPPLLNPNKEKKRANLSEYVKKQIS